MRCEEDGCTNDATHSVTINIPAVGVPIDCHQPLKLYVDVKLCLDHAKTFGHNFSWEENKTLKESILNFISESNFGARDFDRTFASSIRLTDPGFQEVEKYLNRDK